MPYVITTNRLRHGAFVTNHRYRHAVATLEEARRWVTRGVSDSGRKAGSPDYATAVSLPESGGTIGPLPDGTLIDVKQVSDFFLRDAVPHSKQTSEADLIHAFNTHATGGTQ